MSSERKILLIVLEILSLGLIWQIFGSTLAKERSLLERKIRMNNQLITAYEEKSAKIEQKNSPDSSYSEKLQGEVIHLYQLFDHETDLYQRGITLRERLQNSGLISREFREIRSKEGSFMEFTLTGRPESFLTFLENPGEPVRILYFTLDSQRSSITMGIAPARLPGNISPPPGYAGKKATLSPPAGQIPPVELAALFSRPPVKITPPPARPQIKLREQSPMKDRLTYVGRVKTREAGEVYGFKEPATGKMILVSLLGTMNIQGWALKKEEERRFLLSHENTLYEVDR